MNTLYTDTKSTFNAYPQVPESQWAYLCIATGSFVVGYTLLKLFTHNTYGFKTDAQRGHPIKRSGIDLPVSIEPEVRLALKSKLVTY